MSCLAFTTAAPSQDRQGAAVPPPPAFAPLRYAEDHTALADPAARTGSVLALEPLKHIALSCRGDWYLSLGGEVREQYEIYGDPDFGLSPPDPDGYLLQRYMLHGDLHLGPWVRAFAQVKSALASFQDVPPGPADVDRLDLHQAFVDVGSRRAREPAAGLTLRAGRQEMLYGSQRLVSVREGPNVRRSFDAVRLLTRCRDWQLDGFWGRPVATEPGTFDDWGEDGTRFWGVYATGPLRCVRGLYADAYYLGLDTPYASFEQGQDEEQRHSFGVRLFGKGESLDYDCEGVYQWGKFGRDAIRAWTLASDTGYTFAAVPLRPRVALRTSVISGDRDPGDDELGTFNPLFPRGNYFGESAIVGPVNLLDLHPIVQLQLAATLSLEMGWGFFWRYSKDDGLYGNGLNLIQASAGSDERRIGSELSFLLGWQVHRHVSLSSSYSHFFTGPFLDATGPGRDVDYFTVFATYRF